MPDFDMDTEAVRTEGSALRDAAESSPTEPPTMDLSGSAAVDAAYEDWAMWLKASLLQLQDHAASIGRSAVDAADAFDAEEAALADSAQS